MMARFLALVVGIWLCLPAMEARADDLRGLIQQLNTKDFAALEQTVNQIAATGDSRAARALTALGDGKLYYRKKDDQVFIAEKGEKGRDLFDPITGEFVENVSSRKAKRIGINNSLRRAIRGAMGSLTLLSTDPAVRLAAAQSLFKSPDPGAIAALDNAIAQETDDDIGGALTEARAVSVRYTCEPCATGYGHAPTTAIRLTRNTPDRGGVPR